MLVCTKCSEENCQEHRLFAPEDAASKLLPTAVARVGDALDVAFARACVDLERALAACEDTRAGEARARQQLDREDELATGDRLVLLELQTRLRRSLTVVTSCTARTQMAAAITRIDPDAVAAPRRRALVAALDTAVAARTAADMDVEPAVHAHSALALARALPARCSASALRCALLQLRGVAPAEAPPPRSACVESLFRTSAFVEVARVPYAAYGGGGFAFVAAAGVLCSTYGGDDGAALHVLDCESGAAARVPLGATTAGALPCADTARACVYVFTTDAYGVGTRHLLVVEVRTRAVRRVTLALPYEQGTSMYARDGALLYCARDTADGFVLVTADITARTCCSMCTLTAPTSFAAVPNAAPLGLQPRAVVRVVRGAVREICTGDFSFAVPPHFAAVPTRAGTALVFSHDASGTRHFTVWTERDGLRSLPWPPAAEDDGAHLAVDTAAPALFLQRGATILRLALEPCD
eukprot:gnl/Chilomastix_cuspidata/3197.p1 GENE.gnl/Chilomastix_cuspidata/3197~~gnl/Chilomastix_cuspidata/3197.p1  ORF type:complete len:502 (-),score=61.67 gnl/Chilomastix_cuspidata/3197:39-1448(-)